AQIPETEVGAAVVAEAEVQLAGVAVAEVERAKVAEAHVHPTLVAEAEVDAGDAQRRVVEEARHVAADVAQAGGEGRGRRVQAARVEEPRDGVAHVAHPGFERPDVGEAREAQGIGGGVLEARYAGAEVAEAGVAALAAVEEARRRGRGRIEEARAATD